MSYYVAMEEFCMEANVAKAIEIREHSADSLTTSMVDDAFFILQKVCFREPFQRQSQHRACRCCDCRFPPAAHGGHCCS